jgi:hypothetical protein
VEICAPSTQYPRHATAAWFTAADSGTDCLSSRKVKQKAEPPLRRKDGSGVVTTS